MISLLRPVVAFAIGLTIVTLLCMALERWFSPQRRAQGDGHRLLRLGWQTDLIYAIASPLVRMPRRLAIGVGLVPVALAVGHGLDLRALLHGFGPLAAQPRWLQGLEMLMIGDFIGYWEHRAFHCRRLWPIHAVHHSSPQLDWLAAFRVHPVNDIVSAVGRVVPLVALGFSPLMLAGVLPVLGFHAILLHADVDWTFGPLRHAISSPAFHRWHHTAEASGRDRNFAGLLPIWDITFGTFWMPESRCPHVGIDEAVPSGWLAQLVWPFRRRTAIGQ